MHGWKLQHVRFDVPAAGNTLTPIAVGAQQEVPYLARAWHSASYKVLGTGSMRLMKGHVHVQEKTVSPAAHDDAAGPKQESGELEADIDLGPGMFDEDAAGMLNVAPASKPKTLEDLVGPWGGYGTSKKKGSKIKSTSHLGQTITSIHALQVPVFLA